jgi:hypothetical protein
VQSASAIYPWNHYPWGYAEAYSLILKKGRCKQARYTLGMRDLLLSKSKCYLNRRKCTMIITHHLAYWHRASHVRLILASGQSNSISHVHNNSSYAMSLLTPAHSYSGRESYNGTDAEHITFPQSAVWPISTHLQTASESKREYSFCSPGRHLHTYMF